MKKQVENQRKRHYTGHMAGKAGMGNKSWNSEYILGVSEFHPFLGDNIQFIHTWHDTGLCLLINGKVTAGASLSSTFRGISSPAAKHAGCGIPRCAWTGQAGGMPCPCRHGGQEEALGDPVPVRTLYAPGAPAWLHKRYCATAGRLPRTLHLPGEQEGKVTAFSLTEQA